MDCLASHRKLSASAKMEEIRCGPSKEFFMQTPCLEFLALRILAPRDKKAFPPRVIRFLQKSIPKKRIRALTPF